MRERAATVNLEDDDIVGVAVAPIKPGPTSAPPRKLSAPPPPPVAKTSVPPAPQSQVVVKGSAGHASSIPVPTSAKVETPALAFPPARVPSFEVPAAATAAPSVVPAPVSTIPAPASVAPPPASIVPPPISVAPPASPVAASMPPPPAVAPATPASVSKMRLSVSDPTDLIFDGIYGLTFARSMGEAAEMCAETLARALRARTVVIHTRDLVTGELRAIGAHGDADFDIIGSAEAGDDDLVASAVICNQKSVTMRFDGELPRIAPKRLHAVGAPRTVVAAPAMSWGRCVAIIEIIDADETFAARVADSAAYVADHFAQFVSAHAA